MIDRTPIKERYAPSQSSYQVQVSAFTHTMPVSVGGFSAPRRSFIATDPAAPTADPASGGTCGGGGFDVDVTTVPLRPMTPGTLLGRSPSTLSNLSGAGPVDASAADGTRPNSRGATGDPPSAEHTIFAIALCRCQSELSKTALRNDLNNNRK